MSEKPLSRPFIMKVAGIEMRKPLEFKPTNEMEELSKLACHKQIYGYGLDVHGEMVASSPYASQNKMIEMLHSAFMEHLAVELSPDHLWLIIVQQLAIFVSMNKDELKGKLVKSEGKIVVRDDSLSKSSTTNDWTFVLNQFEKGCRKLIVNEKLADVVICDFGTSTPATRVASQVGLFDILSNYVSFSTMTLSGIPEIHLAGEVADWERLLEKCQMLVDLEIGLEGWMNTVMNVVKEIVKTVNELEKGSCLENDESLQFFWRSIYHYENKSGGPKVSGWITALFAYAQTSSGFQLRPHQEDWRPRPGGGMGPGDFPPSRTSAPMTWDYLGTEIPCKMIGGLLALQTSSDNVLSVVPGWAIVSQATDFENWKK